MPQIQALTIDLKNNEWHGQKGFIKREVDMPVLDEKTHAKDASFVIVKVKFAGVCGSDRGMWKREAFTDLLHKSLEKEQKTMRILGHEFVGEIVEVGSLVGDLYGIQKGDTVSGDSHITCGKCYQCRIGEQEVCQDQAIMGISIDGVFAQYVKIPAKNLWVVDLNRVRPEICAMYDPFGNAVQALTRVDIRGARVAVFGCGQIGLFSILLARQFGAAKIIAVDVNTDNVDTALKLGAHAGIVISPSQKEHGYDHDPEVIAQINELTYGKGVDVSMEMAGFNSSINNCIEATRYGGQVILFGIKDGDVVIPKFSKMVVKGLTLHNIIGRQIFKTWQIAQRVLSDKSNGVQDKMWEEIMHGGNGPVIQFSQFSAELMEEKMRMYPKLVFDMEG
ncbi:MAG: alcohol dehydrogenase catalytic domain-containing protein [Candidatus Magasanikbacteria bacterium]|nr:alcohol dehydrogenase catalytic domain-containing protein [Candidatus Magasanikbacteria bacterium]